VATTLLQISPMACACRSTRLKMPKSSMGMPFSLKSAWMKDQHLNYGIASAYAKQYAADIAMEVTTEAVQIHGGYGYVKEYHVERLMREAKLTQIYEGTSEVQKIVISRSLLKD